MVESQVFESKVFGYQVFGYQVDEGAASLARGRSEISESGAAIGDVGGTRQEAPLAGRTIKVRQADRGLSDQARSIAIAKVGQLRRSEPACAAP